MNTRMINTASLCATALATLGAAGGAAATEPQLSLTQDPLVMRLSKDEFRIAFSINAEQAAASGCDGVIYYRVDWKAEDGITRSEHRLVTYSVPPRASRTITVDRQYFDTAEAKHTTDLVKVSVDSVKCNDNAESSAPAVASTMTGLQ